MNEKTPFFKNLWDITVKICRKAHIPLYCKRHDPKVFTTVQKLFLLLYKTKKKLTLRGLVDDLASSKVVSYLGLCRIPNFSTLSYFITHLPMSIMQMVHDAVQSILPDFDAAIIDSTGFECTNPSHYYCQRCNSPYPVDGFISLHAIIDQENGYIRSFKTIATKVHDSTTLKTLVKKLKKKIKILYADRGYDSEENSRFLAEEIGCTPLILQKNMLKPLHKCKGEYRREMRAIFDYGEYLKRNKIESIFHSIKTKYQSTLQTKTITNQKKELTTKIILYNLEKKITTTITLLLLYIKRVFNRAIEKLK